jgi:dienelactone hydrolase
MRRIWRFIRFVWRTFLGLVLVLVLVLALAWAGSEVLKMADPGAYAEARDWVRVTRTKYFRPGQRYRFLESRPEYRTIDAAALIRVHSVTDVWTARADLLRAIWGEQGLPADLRPTRIERGIEDATFSPMPEVARIDRLVRETPPGFLSNAYHLVPRTPNGKLVLYHEGNTGPFHRNARVLQRFLAEGYDVLAFSMWIIDRQPEIAVPGAGALYFIDHEFLKFLERDPMRVYFDPLVAGLNALLEEGAYDDVIAVGFSGGGWAVTVWSAFDPRIRLSYPVAGNYPLYLRKYRNWSTWQEHYPPMIAAANYLDMYVMAAAGDGRRQMQVLNQYDACCYSGLDWQTYEKAVRAATAGLGDGWDIFVDDSHADHRISTPALDRILADIAAHPRPN